jgi:hypothetical protein
MNMKKNKKGFGKVAVAFIIATIVGILLVSFGSKMTSSVLEYVDDDKCKGYVLVASFLEDLVARESYNELLYSVQFYCNKFEEKLEGKNQDEQFREIADSMVRCWNKFGKGDVNFFNKWEIKKSNSKLCFTCGIIHPNPDVNIPSTYYKDDFLKFLKTEKKEVNEKTENGFEKVQKKYIDLFLPGVIGIEASEEFEKREENNKKQLEEMTTNKEELYELGSNFDVSIQGLKYKKINTNEKIYLVYRYDRFSRSFSQTVKDMTKSSLSGTKFGVLGSGVVISASCILFPPMCIAGGFTLIGGSVVLGGVAGTILKGGKNYLINSKNNIQYVDIMDFYEYRRTCGNEPPLN